MLDLITNWITPSVENFRVAGYWIAFLAAMSETVLGVGLFLPGSTVILLLGAFAARGYLDPGDLIWFAFIGAVLGDNINYFLGRRYGARWAEGGFWFLRQEHFEKARTFFDRHGAVSVLWGRLIPTVKEVVPFIAGMVRMHRGLFYFWNVLGAVCWAFLWVLAGYFFAQSLYLARIWLSRLGFFAAVLITVILLLAVVRRGLVKHGRPMLDLLRSVAHSVKQAVVNNPEVGKLVRRHERLFGFLGRRLDNNRFTGLPLTLQLAAFLYILALFGGVVEDLLTGDTIVAADLRISSLMAVFRTPPFVRFFLWVTMLGKSQVILVFSLVLVTVLYLWRERHLVLPFLVTLSGSVIFTYLGKAAFHRPRPEISVYTELSFSFPSGHAVISVAFYGFIVYLLVSRTQVWKWKVNYIFTGALVALLIGFSRVYLGVHYLSDVWSGYLIGSLWLIIGIALAQYRKSISHVDTAALVSWKRWAVPALVASALLFYAWFTAGRLPEIRPSPGSEDRGRVVSTPGDIFSNEQLKFTENVTGERQQPINVVLVSEGDRQLIHTLRLAGWLPDDALTPFSLLKAARASLSGTDYPSAPVMPYFWGAHVNDFALRNPIDFDGKGITHILYLWQTALRWGNSGSVYVGQVSRGRSLSWMLARRINLDVDGEREFFLQSLTEAIESVKYEHIDLVGPSSGRNALGDLFVTDGKAALLILEPGRSQLGD